MINPDEVSKIVNVARFTRIFLSKEVFSDIGVWIRWRRISLRAEGAENRGIR